ALAGVKQIAEEAPDRRMPGIERQRVARAPSGSASSASSANRDRNASPRSKVQSPKLNPDERASDFGLWTSDFGFVTVRTRLRYSLPPARRWSVRRSAAPGPAARTACKGAVPPGRPEPPRRRRAASAARRG